MLKQSKNILYLFIVSMFLISNSSTAKNIDKDLDETSKQEIIERLSPFIHNCKQGEPCAALASTVADKSSGKARTAEDIYNKFCSACHLSGILDAPKKGNLQDWEKHLARHKGSFTDMWHSAIKGIGAMPPRGNCADCSDDEIKMTVEFMSGLKP